MLRDAGTFVDEERSRPLAGWMESSGTGRNDVDLAPADLGALVAELAARPEMAACIARLRPGAGGRAWEHLWRDEHVDVWLIAWDGGADTGWHDHDVSSGAFRVLDGTVVEERPRWSGTHRSEAIPVGGGATFGPEHVHRINTRGGRALTLHAYSPPLVRLGQYDMDDDGVVRRRTIGWEDELGVGAA